MAPTTYIVCREVKAKVAARGSGAVEERTTLDILGTASAETPRLAIKAFSEPGVDIPADGNPVVLEGAYVAVPTRNWTEEEVAVEHRVSYRSREVVPGGGRELIHVPASTIPGQTTIDNEEEAQALADAIEGDPNEFGPEVEEPFDPANLGGAADGPQSDSPATEAEGEGTEPDDGDEPPAAA